MSFRMLDGRPLVMAKTRAEILREALTPFARIALARDANPNAPDCIDAPDLAITPDDVRRARKALGS